jgi:hypothetical protein
MKFHKANGSNSKAAILNKKGILNSNSGFKTAPTLNTKYLFPAGVNLLKEGSNVINRSLKINGTIVNAIPDTNDRYLILASRLQSLDRMYIAPAIARRHPPIKIQRTRMLPIPALMGRFHKFFAPGDTMISIANMGQTNKIDTDPLWCTSSIKERGLISTLTNRLNVCFINIHLNSLLALFVIAPTTFISFSDSAILGQTTR